MQGPQGPPLHELPADCTARVLAFVPVTTLPSTLRALRLTCTSWNAALLRDDALWHALIVRLGGASSAQCASPSARRSARLVRPASDLLREAYASLVRRTDALHHATACAGQDAKHLTVRVLSRLHTNWEPVIEDRISPVYGVTLLTEVCKGRCAEGHLCGAAAWLLEHGVASAHVANADGLSPLIVAAARGMPRLVRLLLTHGADARAAGSGRFRLLGSRRTVAGRHSAREWVGVILAAEAALQAGPGSPQGAAARRATAQLRECERLLSEPDADDQCSGDARG